MDSQYKLLSELLSDQAAFITSPKTSLANYWGVLPPCPPLSTGLIIIVAIVIIVVIFAIIISIITITIIYSFKLLLVSK